jgi:hypothetical protein
MRSSERKPSSVPYATSPVVVTGAKRVRHISGLVFIGELTEDHTISLILDDGTPLTIHFQEVRSLRPPKKKDA